MDGSQEVAAQDSVHIDSGQLESKHADSHSSEVVGAGASACAACGVSPTGANVALLWLERRWRRGLFFTKLSAELASAVGTKSTATKRMTATIQIALFNATSPFSQKPIRPQEVYSSLRRKTLARRPSACSSFRQTSLAWQKQHPQCCD